MCTLVKPDDQITITNEDIICYKIVRYNTRNKYYYAPYQFYYAYNKGTNSSTITFGKTDLAYDCKPFSGLERESYAKCTGLHFAKEVVKGFHSFLSLETLKQLSPFLRDEYVVKDVYVKCIIPLGSNIIKGYCNNIVSSQLIILEECV